MGVIGQDVIDEVLERSAGACEALTRACVGTGQHFHHRQLRRHGDHTAANLLHVCQPCHTLIHAQPADAYLHGWLVHSWSDPAEVPVIRYRA